jgi:hypothetical protein
MDVRVNDWDSVRRHPVVWAMSIFLWGFLVIGFGAYFARGATLYEACVVGTGCGLVLALLVLSSAGIGGEQLALPPLRRFTIFNVLTALGGLAVVLAGIATGDWSMALAGLPLLGLGIAMMLARHVLLRTKR